MQILRSSQDIEITIDYTKTVNTDEGLGEFILCSFLSVKNLGNIQLNNLKLSVKGNYIKTTDYTISSLEKDSSVTLDSSRIKLIKKKLSEVKDNVNSEIIFEIKEKNQTVDSISLPIILSTDDFIEASEEISENELSDILGFDNSLNSAPSKREEWERKLLDLSLRNPMLNLRPNRSIVPIREKSINTILQYLLDKTLIDHVGKQDISEIERLKDLLNLYRSATNRLEETGANSLFVALGSLRWFDGADKRPHIAPLIFIPATINRLRPKNYEIRLRDDEPIINVSLIEMLRQKFGASITELESLPCSKDGMPDWKKIFEIIQQHIDYINKRQPGDLQWKLLPSSYVGVFTFTKFLLWNDIHSNPEVIQQHPILRGFIENNYIDDKNEVDIKAGQIEVNPPEGLIMPLAYDASQLEAVSESHAGKSFVLHGPPGTGKSQTITNMIADAIFNGKRVLFVAEKKAALEVVRARLNSIGLMPYCLELHSNKTDKNSFFTQIRGSKFKVLRFKDTEIHRNPTADVTAPLNNCLNTLKSLTEAIHTPRYQDLSLYECIARYIAKGPLFLPLRYNEINSLQPSDIDIICKELSSFDLIERVLGEHPSKSPFKGLYPLVNDADNQQQLNELLEILPDAVEKSKQKAIGWFNRFLMHKTSEEILFRKDIWKQLLSLATVDEKEISDIVTIEKKAHNWRDSKDKLRKWYFFSDKINLLKPFNLSQALDFYYSGNSGYDTAVKTEAGYYHALAEHSYSTDPILRAFNSQIHEDLIRDYSQLTGLQENIFKQNLLSKLENSLRDHVLSKEEYQQSEELFFRILANGRGVPLRKVIAESEDVIQLLFPCMLMSPLSVAKYLELRPGMFDLVIFDEASQMETPDAVGAIARGKELVVVGDPKQLPPTRFFTSHNNSGEEREENDDSESILEDCIKLGLHSRYLSQHYRSRHESLIYFSNYNFYDNELLTFPSHNDSQRKVSLFDPQGIYDIGKTRTNLIEAKAVVNYITKLIRENDKTPSLGVVAFSKTQSDLIEDLLNEELMNDQLLQKKLNDAEETIFIKNLENVQGDERDIIIFSIGYGPDVNGNVSLNFGPLNKFGGERRLNVAVTRAREEMVVFSSLKPMHIPSDNNLSLGTIALRNFLIFAASPVVDKSRKNEVDSDAIVEDIATRLRKRGHEVVTHVGRSAFKIDVAIIDPDDPETYKLGIILDGKDYNNLPTVRDREITVPGVLKGLGWEIARIWVLDWFENPEAVLDSLSL